MTETKVDLSPKAEEAFDEIDDCMRMDIKVEPIGALKALREELERLTAIERNTAQWRDMAACMELLRTNCIEVGVIDASVAPMFYTEAVISLASRMRRAEAECAAWRAKGDQPGAGP